MPVIKSAKKKLRQDKKREKINNILRKNVAKTIRIAKKEKNSEKIRVAIKFVDKSVKKGLMHKNKAARIKSTLSKLVKHPISQSKKTSKISSKTKSKKS